MKIDPATRARWKAGFRSRKIEVYRNGWAVIIAFLSIFSAGYSILHPGAGDPAIYRQLGHFIYVWNILYLLGGLGIVLGLIIPNRLIDIFGLTIFSCAILINGISYLFLPKLPAGASPALTFGFSLAAIFRIIYIIKYEPKKPPDAS